MAKGNRVSRPGHNKLHQFPFCGVFTSSFHHLYDWWCVTYVGARYLFIKENQRIHFTCVHVIFCMYVFAILNNFFRFFYFTKKYRSSLKKWTLQIYMKWTQRTHEIRITIYQITQSAVDQTHSSQRSRRQRIDHLNNYVIRADIVNYYIYIYII